MGIKISALTESLATINTDIFHLRTSGGIDKKITNTNLFDSDLVLSGDNTISGDNTFSGENEFSGYTSKINIAKGYMQVALTNYTGTGLPAIVANSIVEINGTIYTNPSEVAISGATANTTWYDILLTPSGTTFTASFIARETGTWSDSKQGLYSGNNRVVACVRRDTSSSIWVSKNILIVNNRTIKIKMNIGDWNMNQALGSQVQVYHGVTNILKAVATIRNDADSRRFTLATSPGSGTDRGLLDAWIHQIETTNARLNAAGSNQSGQFSTVDFNATSYNRGWMIVDYEV